MPQQTLLLELTLTENIEWHYSPATNAERFLLEQDNPPGFGRIGVAQELSTGELDGRQGFNADTTNYSISLKPVSVGARRIAIRADVLETLENPWTIRLYEVIGEQPYLSSESEVLIQRLTTALEGAMTGGTTLYLDSRAFEIVDGQIVLKPFNQSIVEQVQELEQTVAKLGSDGKLSILVIPQEIFDRLTNAEGGEARAKAYTDAAIGGLVIPVSALDIGAIPATDKGQPLGVASLNQNGKVPTVELPQELFDRLAEAEAGEGRAKAYADAAISAIPSPTAQSVGAIPLAQKGVANGVSSLGADAKVPLVQLTLPTSEQVGAIANNQKGIAGGVASLDANARLPVAQIPQSVLDRITTLETQMAGLLNQPVANNNELVTNTGFTSGTSPWYGVVGDEQLSTAQISGKSGNVLQVGGRVDATRGAAIDIAFSKNNSVLRVQYWSRSASGGTTLRCKAKLLFDDGTSTTITLGTSGLSTAPTLTDFISPVISWTKNLVKFTIFFDTSGGTSIVYLDDVSVTEVTEVYSYSFASGISNAWMMAGQQISLVQDGGVQVARNGGNYSSLEKHQQNGIIPLQAGSYRLICNCRLDAASTIFRMYWNEHTTYKDITELTYVDVGYDFVLSAAISSAKFGVIANGSATTAGCLIRSFRIVKLS